MHPIVRQWYQLLVVEARAPISVLLRPNVGEAFNLPGLPCTLAADLLEGVRELVQDGCLVVHSRKTSLEEQPLSAHEFARRIRDGNLEGLVFGLTEEGGSDWEKHASADWGRYILEESDSESAFFASMSFERLIAYAGWYPVLAQVKIHWDSVVVEQTPALDVTYWKQLKNMWTLRCKFDPSGNISLGDWFYRWRREFRKWHDVPWDSPDWKRLG